MIQGGFMNKEQKIIERTTRGRVRIYTWKRRPANAYAPFFLDMLCRELRRTEEEDGIACVVLKSGLPGVFSSGLDLRALTAGESCRRGIFLAVRSVHRLIKQILNSRKIYIAALSGAVIGSAVSLAVACDFRMASQDTWFWLPDPQYGGLLGDGALTLMARSFGAAAAKRLCLSNERISAEEAYRLGVIEKPDTAEKSAEQALLLADRLGELSSGTLRHTKRILNRDIPVKFAARRLLNTVRDPDMLQRLAKFRLR